MPVHAKDKHHDAVINALRKADWTTIDEQVMIILEERRLWIDLQIARPDHAGAILIEIKGFENMPVSGARYRQVSALPERFELLEDRPSVVHGRSRSSLSRYLD